jgi:hypothetical protein
MYNIIKMWRKFVTVEKFFEAYGVGIAYVSLKHLFTK